MPPQISDTFLSLVTISGFILYIPKSTIRTWVVTHILY